MSDTHKKVQFPLFTIAVTAMSSIVWYTGVSTTKAGETEISVLPLCQLMLPTAHCFIAIGTAGSSSWPGCIAV